MRTASLALAALATGCAHQEVPRTPWHIYAGFRREQERALEEIIALQDDEHPREEHDAQIAGHLASVYCQHPQRDTSYATTGLYLTNGIVLTVDHAVRDTFLVDPTRRHFIEHQRRQRRIRSVLARHPEYDLALIKIEDSYFFDPIHIHVSDPYQDMDLDVIAYQSNRHWRERTSVLSNSDIVSTNGGTHIDMFRIRRHFGRGWSGAAVVNYARGHLVGLVSASPTSRRYGFSSCSRAVHITGIQESATPQ